MTTGERRQVVERVQAAAGVSERKAIRFTGFPSSTMRYRSVRPPQEELRERIKPLSHNSCAKLGGQLTCSCSSDRLNGGIQAHGGLFPFHDAEKVAQLP